MAKPLGPYTPAVRAGDLVIISGQTGVRDGALVAGGLEPELRQVLDNLGAVLEGEGLRRDQVVKTMVFLTDMGDFAAMNAIYSEWFGDVRPARSCIGVAGLPVNACVEIEAWVHAPA